MTNLFLFLLLLLLLIQRGPTPSSAFTLKLHHRDSPLSPLYQPNLTASERHLAHAAISSARAALLAAKDASIRLPAKLEEPTFTVEIGIGTPAVRKHLIFDTGSDLTWTQCRPCLRCFKQNDTPFDPKKSSTYKTLNKRHPLAPGFTCTLFGCGYRSKYYTGQFSNGRASTETFTFHSSLKAAPVSVANLVFGCGNYNGGNFPPEVSGILGMDKEPTSFIRQLGGLVKGRFSYCISPTTASYVRFGDEARLRGRNGQKTPFLVTKNKKTTVLYTLDLTDVSINGKRLGAKFPDGCFIDSGASVSLLNTKAYAAVKDFIASYFANFKNVVRYAKGPLSKKFMCYKYPNGFGSFPTMTFHLRGADWQVPVGNLFLFVEGNIFCLAMMESKDISILGAYQQRNVRVVYDLKEMMLSFAPEECSRDLQLGD